MNHTHHRKLACLGLALGLAAPVASQAATVTLGANDGFGASSFNTAGTWSDSLAPHSGADYSNAGFLVRTPANSSSHTFAGDSLTITGSGLATSANNEALMWKGSGTGSIITVANLIINGGQLRHGQGDADSVTFAGNLTVGANGANFATQGGMLVNSAIAGSGTIRLLDSGNTSASRLITFGSGANTFTGNMELAGSAGDRLRFTLADGANFNFSIGANGVNNAISGVGTATFNGIFSLDLTAAGTTLGDSWSLVNLTGGSATYGSTFSVAGFTKNEGTGNWEGSNGGTPLVFSPTAGTLTVVPEPSVFALLGLGGLALVLRRRSA